MKVGPVLAVIVCCGTAPGVSAQTIRPVDYFPRLGPAMNRAAGANASMQKIIELREAKAGAVSS